MNKLWLALLLGLLLWNSRVLGQEEDNTATTQGDADGTTDNRGQQENTGDTDTSNGGDNSQYTCGESDEVNKAWTDARSQALQEGADAWKIINESAKAARLTGTDIPTILCIGFVSGISAGADTCEVIDFIVHQSVEQGVSIEEAESLADAAARTRYDWYQGYSQLCGDRPDYEVSQNDDTGNQDGQDTNGDNENICGESQGVHDAWTKARDQVRSDGADAEGEIEAAITTAMDSGADEKTSSCIAFVAGVATGMQTCELINWLVKESLKHGAQADEVEQWLEDAAKKRYDWYQGYDQLCGQRPDYGDSGSDNGENGGTEQEIHYTCGESEEVHNAWTDARKQARIEGKNAKEVIDAATEAVSEMGLDELTTMCIAFDAGTTTGTDTCMLIEWVVQDSVNRGTSVEQAKQFGDNAAMTKYGWFEGYTQGCGPWSDFTSDGSTGESGNDQDTTGQEETNEDTLEQDEDQTNEETTQTSP